MITKFKMSESAFRINGVSALVLKGLSEVYCHERFYINAETERKYKAKDEEEDLKSMMWFLDKKKKRPGIPAIFVKQAIVSSANFLGGEPMRCLALGCVHVKSDKHDLIELKIDKMVADRRDVRVPALKYHAVRTYPRMDKWSAEVRIRYAANYLKREELAEILKNAGQCVGLGWFRPEKGGDLGRFTVKCA